MKSPTEPDPLQRPNAMKGRIAVVLLGWLGAFLIVMILFLLFGKQLQELPLAVRALVSAAF